MKPKNALVSFVYTSGEYTFGGGALLSETCAIAPFIIFRQFYRSRTIYDFQDFANKNFCVAIGLNSFKSNSLNHQHSINGVKHNAGPNCNKDDAIALVIINPISLGGGTLVSSWVQHIPIASQSYTRGLHSVSEFVVAWDEVRKPY